MDRQLIVSAMETDVEKSLKAFNAAAADVLNASLIIVAGKISKLLQTVARSKPLCEYMSNVTRGYNFVEDFRARQIADATGRPVIDVPRTATEQIRFTFCLLFAVDTGKLRLEKFLHTFYTDTDANTEYRAFCAALVRPFAENVNAVFAPAPAPTLAATVPTPAQTVSRVSDEIATEQTELREEETAQDDGAAQEETSAPDEKQESETESPRLQENAPNSEKESGREESMQESEPRVAFAPNPATCESLRAAVLQLSHAVQEDVSVPPSARQELSLVCEALCTAAGMKAPSAMKVMYIAYKNTLQNGPYNAPQDLADAVKQAAIRLGIEE